MLIRSFEPVVTEKIADRINLAAADSPIKEIMSCLVVAKLSSCASTLIRCPYNKIFVTTNQKKMCEKIRIIKNKYMLTNNFPVALRIPLPPEA